MIKVLFIDMNPVGTLQVYAMVTEDEYQANIPVDGRIYWSDDKAYVPYGPFASIYDAMEHWKKTQLQRETARRQAGGAFGINPFIVKSNTEQRNNIVDFAEFKAKKLKYNLPKPE